MVTLTPLTDSHGHEHAIDHLRRWFPERDDEYWRRGLGRAAKVLPSDRPLGFMLESKGAVVGILLTFASRRPGPAEWVVNLSSWYLDERARFAAPGILKRFVDSGDACTDLTPTPAVEQISRAVGFEKIADATDFLPLPAYALLPASGASILTGEATRTLPDDIRSLVADHADLGCISFALRLGEADHAIVVKPVRRRGIATGEVVHADRTALLGGLPVVARHLLGRGIAVLAVDMMAKDKAPTVSIRRPRPPRLACGPFDPARIDYAYSEFVFF
ncbi:MAG TPA: hypothetical protein VMP03_16595 [Methylomirabilota bacterium]|nr:hypothetical protein [Methylomirabilota bacterium]